MCIEGSCRHGYPYQTRALNVGSYDRYWGLGDVWREGSGGLTHLDPGG